MDATNPIPRVCAALLRSFKDWSPIHFVVDGAITLVVGAVSHAVTSSAVGMSWPLATMLWLGIAGLVGCGVWTWVQRRAPPQKSLDSSPKPTVADLVFAFPYDVRLNKKSGWIELAFCISNHNRFPITLEMGGKNTIVFGDNTALPVALAVQSWGDEEGIPTTATGEWMNRFRMFQVLLMLTGITAEDVLRDFEIGSLKSLDLSHLTIHVVSDTQRAELSLPEGINITRVSESKWAISGLPSHVKNSAGLGFVRVWDEL